MIYTGKTASYILQQTLEDVKYSLSKGYFFEKNTWIAFDNSDENCWVEEFHTEAKAICWLKNFFEISEIENFEALKISDELIFIPNHGYLTIKFENDVITSKFYPFSA